MRLDFQRATVEVSALYRANNDNWRFSLRDNAPQPDVDDLARWKTIEGEHGGTHGAQLGQLIESMDQHSRPAVSGPEARRIIEFLACLYKSAFTGQPVLRGTITPDDPFYSAMNGQR